MRRPMWKAALLLASAGAATAQQVPDARRPPIYAPSLPPEADPSVRARPVATPIASLRDAIVTAYSTNPDLLAERATLRSTDERVPAARAGYGPSLNLQASHGYQRDRTEVLEGLIQRRGGFSSTAQAIVNQPLFTFGRLRSAEDQALAQVAFGRDQLRLREAQVLLDVVGAFVAVKRDAQAVRIAQENLDLLGRQYRDSAERFRVREITSTDLQQIETRVEVGRAQLVESQGQLGASRADFLASVGAAPADDLPDPDPLPVEAGTIDQAYSQAENDSALLRAAQSREKISRAGIAAARAEQALRVDLRGSASYGPTLPTSNDLNSRQLRGDVSLSLPLIDSGLRRANLRGAQEANDADRRLIDQALRETRQAVASSWSQLVAARAAIENYARAEDAARRAYEGALEQEKAGARTTLDVLDLLRDLLNARLNLVTARANEQLARANLLAATGRLEAPLLVPGVKAYDPAEHYARVRRKGDVPLLTPALSALDGLAVRENRSDRPVRDPAGPLRTDPPVIRAEPALPPLTKR